MSKISTIGDIDVVMALSGGMDSTTMLAKFIEDGLSVLCVNFQYGSKHNAMEAKAFDAVVKYYNVPTITVDMTTTFANMKSNLLLSGDAIPEGHYAASNMSKTVVPGRNSIFATVMMGIAESIGAQYIALGVHQGDHQIYLDCRAEYVDALDVLVRIATEHKIQVIAPFINTDKTGICRVGTKLKVPYELTRTCYTENEVACGKCGSCCERLTAFADNGIEDPAEYSDRETYKTFTVEGN